MNKNLYNLLQNNTQLSAEYYLRYKLFLPLQHSNIEPFELTRWAYAKRFLEDFFWEFCCDSLFE